MRDVVLGAWLVQATVGITLAVGWWRHGRRGAPTVVRHVTGVLLGLALWVLFTVTGAVPAAWAAFVVLTWGMGFGDEMLLGRVSARTGSSSKRRNYPAAVRAIFRGEMPWRVAFHALFSPVVFFGALGVSIAATVAAL